MFARKNFFTLIIDCTNQKNIIELVTRPGRIFYMSSLHHAPFSSKSRFQISTCFCELDSQHSAQINAKYGIIMVHTFKSTWRRHHCLYHHHDQLQNSRVTECLIYCLSLDGWLKWRYSMAQIHLLSNKCVGAIQIDTLLGGEGYYDPNSHHHLQHIATQKNNVQSSSKSFWYTTMHLPRQCFRGNSYLGI